MKDQKSSFKKNPSRKNNLSPVKVFTDGGARGNPGPAAIGVVFFDHRDQIIKKYSEYIGEQTNNYAEYAALRLALEEARKMSILRLDCFLDSELVVRQVGGVYRVKNKNLIDIFEQVKKLACRFEWIRFSHVVREKNKIADGLVNRALDAHLAR